MKSRTLLTAAISVWISLVSFSFIFNYLNARQEQEKVALQAARNLFEHIVITRLWNARHGGVYVPVSKDTPPNPYLKVPMRDIIVNDHLTLTMVNPAYMTRQISEIARKTRGIQFHITSLKPLRPANKPTPLEKRILTNFEKGATEEGLFIRDKFGRNSYFYMAPLLTRKACLQCHAQQGYKEGDIRGGISVIIPYVMNIPYIPLLVGHGLILVFGLIGIITTGSKLKRAYETARKHAVFDALTGIPNHRSFAESILKEFRRCKRNLTPLSVIMSDVDNFKAYNDTYGHARGDQCLKKVARAIENSLKRPGDFCARYGGEEFVVLLPETDLEGAVHIAETIRHNVKALRIPHEKSEPLKIVTLSLGVATLKESDTITHNELIEQADQALYQAKKQGRNRVCTFKG